MARKTSKKQIEQYEHSDKERANNPHVGLVTPSSDPDTGEKKKYKYDPHLDPQLSFSPDKSKDEALQAFYALRENIQKHAAKIETIKERFGDEAKNIFSDLEEQHKEMLKMLDEAKAVHEPNLKWAGKAEHTGFDVPTVSLHVHERIDPKTIIETVKKERTDDRQMSLFAEQKPLREAIDFYKHKEGWTNRLIAGDSLLVMNSLLEKEGMAGKVQMVYFDPPYGIKYGSNFQPYVQQREVKERDQDLSSEPEMIKAFRDTWELGIHSYLAYIRDRTKLFYELLHESGCVIFQINAENQHRLCLVLDEIFGSENLVANIPFRKKNLPLGGKHVEMMHDHLLIYAKDKESLKYHQLYLKKKPEESTSHWGNVEYDDGRIGKIDPLDFPSLTKDKNPRLFRVVSLLAPSFSENSVFPVEFEGKTFYPPNNGCWIVSKDKMAELVQQNRITIQGKSLVFKMYFDDFPLKKITGLWDDIASSYSKTYAVQTSPQVLERCINLFTDPGDLVLDTTCGSGTTAYASEKLGRRWITCDTSRVAIQLSKQRLMTSLFDYYTLARPEEGIASGLSYHSIETISMKAIANNESVSKVILYDSPRIDTSKARVTGPFTVEAVPAPYAKGFDELEQDASTGSASVDTSIARTGETLRQSEWRDELLRAGVRAKGGNIIQFTRVEPLAGTKYIQADAETREDAPKRVLVVFGPEHAPLEQRMVENAWQEARALKPDMLLFCAFQFDEEAAKDIDELTPAIAGMQLLKAQMNADMLTDDLRKKRSSNESFWLVGQPDIKIHKPKDSKVQVEVMGFDYYNPKTGNVESGGKKNIAMWMLDTDYDNRSLFPSQVFFPMAGSGDGWDKLARNLKAEIDEEKIESFKGTISLPFKPGSAVAVKIIDDRGIESLRVMNL